MQNNRFHPGERAVQERAGVSPMAQRVANGIHDRIPFAAVMFLRAQPIVFAGMEDIEHRVWASTITGEPGFLETVDDQTLRVHALPSTSDPLYAVLTRTSEYPEPAVGLLAIDLAERKRMRLNGNVVERDGRGLVVRAKQMYANCPKYIQSRVPSDPESLEDGRGRILRSGVRLTAEQQDAIRRSDTFFLASIHPEAGADLSHRGGNPGFVRVLSDDALEFPDYAGNMMFNTLGNLAVDPRAGLLFLDFESGDTLQLTGTAEVVWEQERAAAYSGAQRVVAFRVARVVQTLRGLPLHWKLRDYSPFNPPEK